jgi:hypothetical protein
MFALRASKSPSKESQHSPTTFLRHSSLMRPALHTASHEGSEERSSASTQPWSFATVPVNSPTPTANLHSQSRTFAAPFHAIVRGGHSDALSADRYSEAKEPEAPIKRSASPIADVSEARDNDGAPIPIPEGLLQPVSGEQSDSVACHLNYTSSITNQGPPPSDFGLTVYNFLFRNVSALQHLAVPGTPAGSGSPGTPPIPASYEVNGDIQGVITYQVTNSGRTDIASDSDRSITQSNYQKVVADLTPPSAPVSHVGRQFMKNQPFRDLFYARDLTVRHELFHCHEDDRFGQQGAQAAQRWLSAQTANSNAQLLALLPGVVTQVGNTVTAGRAAPADEHRAYADGAPFYLARAQAIKRKGDANGYAPRPAPTPAPRPAPAPQPAPRTAPTGH